MRCAMPVFTEEQKKLLKEFDKSYVANKGKEGFFDKFKKK